MSILAPTVSKLVENNNRVTLDPHNRRHILVIDAVAMVSVLDVPRVLLFSKELREPLEMTDCFQYDPESRDNAMIPEVARTEDLMCYLRREIVEWKTHDELFSWLMSQTSPEFKLLSFSPTEEVYPIYGSDAEDVFDGVETFIDTTGFPQPARMMLQLYWTGREGRNSSERPTKLKYGNVMIWSATSGNIFWATRGKDGVVRALEIAGSAADYSSMLTWVRQYRKDQWMIRGMVAMPYYLPKMSPKEEPKPVDQKPLFHSALDGILNTERNKLDVVTMSLLAASFKAHHDFQKPQVDRSAEYEQLVSDVLNEYCAGKSAANIRLLSEVKTLITAAFVKKFNEENK